MKKLTLIALLISLFQIANAQEVETNKKLFLGGSINFNMGNNTYPYSIININSEFPEIYSINTYNTKNTTFAIAPYFGKEINPHLMAGLQLDYRIGKYKTDGRYVIGQPNTINFEQNSNQIGIGLFTRHILNPTNQFKVFVQPYFEYNLLNEKEFQESALIQESRTSYFALGAGLGVLYTINNSIRATLRSGGINYSNGKWEIKGTDTKNDFSSFGANLSLSSIYFGIEISI